MITRLRIHIEITVVYDPVAGLHPLHAAGIDLTIIAFTVEMFFFPIQNVGECCDAAMRVCPVTIFLYGFIGFVVTWTDMIQEYKWTYRIGVSAGQDPFDHKGTYISPATFG